LLFLRKFSSPQFPFTFDSGSSCFFPLGWHWESLLASPRSSHLGPPCDCRLLKYGPADPLSPVFFCLFFFPLCSTFLRAEGNGWLALLSSLRQQELLSFGPSCITSRALPSIPYFPYFLKESMSASQPLPATSMSCLPFFRLFRTWPSPHFYKYFGFL